MIHASAITTRQPKITPQLVAEIAQETLADERTITKWLAGLPVRGAAGRAVARAFAARGITR